MDIRHLACSALVGASLALSCGAPSPDASRDGAHQQEGRTGGEATERRRQAAKDDGRNHWIAAGEGSRAAFVSKDGSPKTRTAKFVNDGEGTQFSSLGSNGWLVGSSSGWVQLLDDKGNPLREKRETFGGAGGLNFISPGGGGWLIGGDKGDVQEVDRNGQPKGTAQEPFGASASVTAGAFGGSQWLVGTADGRLLRLSAGQLQPQTSVQQLAGSPRIVAIVRSSSSNSWYAFTEAQFSEVTTAGPKSLQALPGNRTVTTVAVDGSTVALGSSDGGVLVSKFSNLKSASWKDAIGKHAVRSLVTDGQKWLAVGEGGQVRALDSSGAPQGSAQTVAAGKDLSIARPGPSKGWWVGIANGSVLQKLDGSLKAPSPGSEILGGSVVREIAAFSEGLVAVGESGQYRMLGAGGSPKGSVQQLSASVSLRSVEWNGSKLMVVGNKGQTAMLDPSGSVSSEKKRLGGANLVGVAWSGRYWLIVTSSGEAQRLRSSGSTYKDKISSGLDTANFVEFNGDQWIIVGSRGSKGAFVMINEDGSIHQNATQLDEISGELYAADWNGREWLVGGDGGMVARIDQAGSLISGGQVDGIRNALYDLPVETIEFNGRDYLIGGGLGAVRKLQFNALPPNPGVVVNNFETVRSIEWADARGFPGGPCISTGFCFSGECIGDKIETAFCCESKCQGPCKSCEGDVTGESDGVCAAVPKGQKAPKRKRDQGVKCIDSSEKSCGTTGFCDGEGACAFYGTDVQCAKPSCEEGVEKSASHCDGSGNCVVDEETQCDPYASCADGEAKCLSSCEGDDDCIDGYACVDGECLDRSELMQADAGDAGDAGTGGGGKGGGGGGCSLAGSGGSPLGVWILLVCLAVRIGRRRRR